MSKREFLMLAKEHDGQPIGGFYWSEKLDGQRAFWDGGISRGAFADIIPWANTAKDSRYVNRPVATGLWSRYGKVIHAPDWWLDLMPRGVTLDLELWMGRKQFQTLRTIVAPLVPGEGWKTVKAMVLDRPWFWQVMADGDIRNANWEASFYWSAISLWLNIHEVKVEGNGLGAMSPTESFPTMEATLGVPPVDPEVWEVWKNSSHVCFPLMQNQLPMNDSDALDQVNRILVDRCSSGAEGLVLRHPTKPWLPSRVNWCLKAKPVHDAEGTVVGFTWGRRTEKGSRHLGRMGALILRLENGKRLELSGFTDDEREVRPAHIGEPNEGELLEGKDATIAWEPRHFPIGSKVTFTYRELTDDGIPKEGRFLRRRTDE